MGISPKFFIAMVRKHLMERQGTHVEDLSEITEKSDQISERLKSRMAVINVARLREAVRKALDV